MRRSRLACYAISLISLLPACGGGDDVQDNASVVRLQTAEFTIPVGESFMCFYTDTITDRELSVINASGVQAAGGHHLTLYYVDNKRPVSAEPCSGTAEMVDWHFAVGAGGEGNTGNLINLSEGLAVRIPAGKQLMIQAHYINTSGKEQTVRDEMTVELTDPAKVKAYVADFVVLDDQFEIPAHGGLDSVSTCKITQDTQLSMLLGHMHEQGKHYKLEKVDAQGNSLETIYEQDWDLAYAAHPPINEYTMEAPLVLPAGTLLRQTCSWINDTSNSLLFPTEMCIAFGYYFPGESRLMCERVDTTP